MIQKRLEIIAIRHKKSLAILLLIVMFSMALAASSPAQEVNLYVSSQAGDRLTAKNPLHFESAKLGGSSFQIQDDVTYQKIVGFGASFLEAGMICLNSLDPAQQEGVLRALFDPEQGAGFSAMKTVLGSTDFMSAGPWFTYDDTPGDMQLIHFSIARDLKPNGLVTYIKRARKYGHFVLQAPMDYPPDWMLLNATDRDKQDVDPKYYDVLAHYYLRYLQDYDQKGVFIDYLSLFNEPGVYTKINYQEICDLIKDHVGPLFAKEGVRTKLQLSEAPTRDNAHRNYPTVLDDPGARKYVAALAYHGYDWTHFDEIADLHRRYPNLPLWMTEICHAYEVGDPVSMPIPRYDFQDGEFWGDQIFSDLEAGASAWIYWNMILDQDGGPWAISPVHGNPDPNAQHPVVIIDRQTKQVTLTGLYYYLAHFSKFVRPGSVRVKTTGSRKYARCIAFKRPDGRVVAEIMNHGKFNDVVRLLWRGRTLDVPVPATSITTLVWPEK